MSLRATDCAHNHKPLVRASILVAKSDALWVHRARHRCNEQRPSVFTAVWCSHLRPGGYRFPEFFCCCSGLQAPSKRTLHAGIELVEACELCQVYTTARCHEIHELSALGYPLVFADSGTTATQCTSTSLRRIAHSLSSKHIGTCFDIQGRRLEIFLRGLVPALQSRCEWVRCFIGLSVVRKTWRSGVCASMSQNVHNPR